MNDTATFNPLQSLLDCSPDLMVLLSRNHQVLAHNVSAVEFLSSYFEEPFAVGKDYRDFVIKSSRSIYKNAFRDVKAGKTVIIENHTVDQDVSHWFEYQMSPVYDSQQKKIVAITLTARNIDIKKMAEAEAANLADTFEAMIQNTAEAITFLDCQGRVLQYNNKAKEQLYLNYGRKIKIGDDFRQFVYPGLINSFTQDFDRTLKGDRSEKGYETTNTNNDPVSIRVKMYPMCQNSEIVGVAMFVLDTLDLKKAEIANHQKSKKLDEITFYHSHNLRSPVAKVLGITRILKEHDLNADQKEFWLNLLLQCTEELDNVIHLMVNEARRK